MFSQKCVLTPKDHFERHFYFSHFRGEGVERSRNFLFCYFLKASLVCNKFLDLSNCCEIV